MGGQNAGFRSGFESSEGVPGHDLVATKISSESLDVKYGYVADPNLDPSGNETEGQILKGEAGGSVMAAPNSEDWLRWRYHMHGYGEVSNPTAGVYLHELRDYDADTDTPLAFYTDSMHFGVWRDERDNPTEMHGVGAKASQFQISVGANEFAQFQHDLVFLRERYVADVADVAVAVGFTGEIHSIGHRNPGDENGDEYSFKITATDGALGTATLLWGKNGAYGTTEYVTSTRMNVKDASDRDVGPPGMPLQILIVPGGVFTEDDEWVIDPVSGKPTYVYSTRPKLHGAACEVQFSLGGQILTRRIDQFTLTHGVPREAKFGVGRIVYAQEIGQPTDAKKWWELSFNSTYVDLKLKQAMIGGRVIEAYVKFYGKQIAATTYDDFADYTLSNMRFTQAGAVVANAGDLPENPVLRAFTPEGTSDPLCVERYQNTIASVAPS